MKLEQKEIGDHIRNEQKLLEEGTKTCRIDENIVRDRKQWRRKIQAADLNSRGIKIKINKIFVLKND